MSNEQENMVAIAILDFGSQFTHLISRRLRDAHIYCEIFAPDIAVEDLHARHVQGLILSGGPGSVYDAHVPPFNAAILDMDVPILGICYGYQLLAKRAGGTVVPLPTKEFGGAEIELVGHSLLFKGLQDTQTVWMSHGDAVAALPPGFSQIASTASCPNAAAEHPGQKRYGIQFHPEVAHTRPGRVILQNFAVEICHCQPDWTMGTYLERSEARISQAVGNRNVFLLVSGGIDSVVVFLLLNRVLGPARVKGLFINTGLLRPGDTAMVTRLFADWGLENSLLVDASTEFLSALTGVSDPEQKRMIIGQTFLTVKDRQMAELGLDAEHWVLAQGTIYPDIITSGGSTHADVIKTHHNALPSLQHIEVLEPLRYLYKDEVRALAAELGLPREFIWKHPFPGPGIGVRIAGTLTAEKIALYHRLDEIVLRHLHTSGWYETLWMGFPILVDMRESCEPGFVFPAPSLDSIVATARRHCTQAAVLSDRLDLSVLPIRSVGVKGDYRAYEHPVELRVTYRGQRCQIPHQVTEALSREIVNRTPALNRTLLTLACSGEPPTWKRIAILRMLLSVDTLTADWARLEHALLDTMAAEIMALHEGVDAVLFDVTQKPPSTMEWE
jgi:GMP synthase (glutamine-hydrolysing)